MRELSTKEFYCISHNSSYMQWNKTTVVCMYSTASSFERLFLSVLLLLTILSLLDRSSICSLTVTEELSQVERERETRDEREEQF